MYMKAPTEEAVAVSGPAAFALLVMALLTIVLGIFPGLFSNLL